MTTIQTQRPTLVYVACFYPDLTPFTGLLLSQHSQLETNRDTIHLAQGVLLAFLGALTVAFFWVRYAIPSN
jgi:hypothetical protein